MMYGTCKFHPENVAFETDYVCVTLVEGETVLTTSDQGLLLAKGDCYSKLQWSQVTHVEYLNTLGYRNRWDPSVVHDPTLRVEKGEIKKS